MGSDYILHCPQCDAYLDPQSITHRKNAEGRNLYPPACSQCGSETFFRLIVLPLAPTQDTHHDRR